jgi:acyl carrier protein
MTQGDDVQSTVLDVLREVQKLSGREWSDLAPETKPIGSLDGFDSLSAVEATVMIEEKLGCKLDIDSVFVSDDGRRALTLKEISERLSKLLTGKGGAT